MRIPEPTFLPLPRLLRRLLGCGLLILVVLSLPTLMEAKESPYKQGLHHYAKGEFDKAVKSLQKALNKKPSKSEKVKIYKYIGMSLYTLGRQAEAEKNFEQCLATDAACSIEAKEALDESVLPFFQNIKRRIADKKPAPQPKTRILVKTPVKDAEILMDGILLGPANTSLEASPGTREITLQAKGYKPRHVKIAVTKLVENVYEIDLEKAPPKVDPREKERQAKREKREREKQRDEERRRKREKEREREREEEREREKERARRLEARRAREEKKEKVPPVLPAEDETAKNLKDPGPESRKEKESLELPEEKGPQATASKPQAAPAPEPIELEREPVSIAHFLPLGIGQFYNGDYLLGSLFLGTQLYAAGVIITANQDIQQANDNEQAAIRRAQVDPTVTQDDLDAFALAKQKFVKDKQQRINLALGAAGGTYVFGVLHALIMRPYNVPQSVSLVMQPIFATEAAPEAGLQLELHWNF